MKNEVKILKSNLMELNKMWLHIEELDRLELEDEAFEDVYFEMGYKSADIVEKLLNVTNFVALKMVFDKRNEVIALLNKLA